MVQFCVVIFEMLEFTYDKKKFCIETEKFEQTLFALFVVCAINHFKDNNTRPDHAELLSLNICRDFVIVS